MDIGKAIYKILSDNIAVASLVGTRIAPNVMKQTSPFPFIVYDVNSEPEGQKDSVALLDKASVMVSAYCKTYSEASTLANYIRTALDRVNGLYVGVNIQAINFQGYDDVFDDMSGSDGIYRKSLNFDIRILNSFNNIYSTNFDGVDDYVAIDGISAVLDYTSGSVSLWAKTETTTSNRAYFSSYIDSNNFISVSYAHSANEVKVNYKGGGSTKTSSTTDVIEGDGLWHNIIATWDESGLLSLYLDGVLKDTAASLPTILYSGFYVSASIGNNANSGQYFLGNIDEVSLFNVELTASQVTTLYNDGLPYTVAADTGLIGWWRMGDGGITGNPIATFPTIPDDSSNSNNGTMTNMTSTDFEADVPE
tara:strand:- start:4479 stop:5570 length:1092 start_codon:yes stop_codon:yes gene_type:complete